MAEEATTPTTEAPNQPEMPATAQELLALAEKVNNEANAVQNKSLIVIEEFEKITRVLQNIRDKEIASDKGSETLINELRTQISNLTEANKAERDGMRKKLNQISARLTDKPTIGQIEKAILDAEAALAKFNEGPAGEGTTQTGGYRHTRRGTKRSRTRRTRTKRKSPRTKSKSRRSKRRR